MEEVVPTEISDEIQIFGFPPHVLQRFIDNVYKFINYNLGKNFKSRGYRAIIKELKPLKNKRNLPQGYDALKGYKIKFLKNKDYGTTIELTWDGEKLNTLYVNITESPRKKTRIIWPLAGLFSAILYTLTILYPMFWILVLASGLLCCLLSLIIALIPGIIGSVIGILLGDSIYQRITPKEIKERPLGNKSSK